MGFSKKPHDFEFYEIRDFPASIFYIFAEEIRTQDEAISSLGERGGVIWFKFALIFLPLTNPRPLLLVASQTQPQRGQQEASQYPLKKNSLPLQLLLLMPPLFPFF